MRRVVMLLLATALLVLPVGAEAAASHGSLAGSWLRSEDMAGVQIAGHGGRFAGRVPAAQASAKLGCRYPRGFGMLSLRFRYVERHGSRVRVRRAYTGVLRDFPAGAPGCLTMRWRITARVSRGLDALTVTQAGTPSGFVFHFLRSSG